jgi:hypothetical protein
MPFQAIGNHLFKVSVEEQTYLSLIVYGQDCTQEEARGMQDSHYNDNQALTSHAKRGKRNRRSFSKAFKDKKTSTTPSHEHTYLIIWHWSQYLIIQAICIKYLLFKSFPFSWLYFMQVSLLNISFISNCGG